MVARVMDIIHPAPCDNCNSIAEKYPAKSPELAMASSTAVAVSAGQACSS
jgi:hypothetical protein